MAGTSLSISARPRSLRERRRDNFSPGHPSEKLERETGFEPATSTLARSHSTTELFPPAGAPARPCGRTSRSSRTSIVPHGSKGNQGNGLRIKGIHVDDHRRFRGRRRNRMTPTTTPARSTKPPRVPPTIGPILDIFRGDGAGEGPGELEGTASEVLVDEVKL